MNYDAGTWTVDEIIALGSLYSVDASTNYTFGGFTEGSSRNTSVTPVNSNKNGWQILDTEEIDGTTYITMIISAGSPEKYKKKNDVYDNAYKSKYILGGGTKHENGNEVSSSTFIGLTARNWNMYRDTDWGSTGTKTYADSNTDVKLITQSEIKDSNYAQIKNNGSIYWLPNVNQYDNTALMYVNYGNISSDYHGIYGIRPVITLKSGVTVKGTGTDHSTPDKAWKLQ